MVERVTPALLAGLDDLVATFQSDFQRLLDDYVFAGPRGGKGRLQVRPAGRADGDHFDRRIGEHRVQIVVGGATGDFGQLVGSRRNRVVACHKFRTANVRDRPGMEMGDHPATDNAEADGHDDFSESHVGIEHDYKWIVEPRPVVAELYSASYSSRSVRGHFRHAEREEYNAASATSKPDQRQGGAV